MKGDGTLEYVGNRFDHEYQFPAQQEFEWKRAHRDMQRPGEHPHISIEDRVFVETVGGDLTIKVEDNTESGSGIYEEPVTEADQTLDDAEILYAIVGPLILLKILPYREDLYRYLVFNEKTQTVHRVDAIGHSCVLLPDEQGIIFLEWLTFFSPENRRSLKRTLPTCALSGASPARMARTRSLSSTIGSVVTTSCFPTI